MKKIRSTFRSRKNGPDNSNVFGFRNLQNQVRRGQVQMIKGPEELLPNLPGETNRQFAVRMRGEQPAVPVNPARKSRAKAAA